MKYREALEYIESIQSYGIVPGLDSITELCRRLQDPQDQLKFIHIAGTNGKGSVLAYLSAILKEAGYTVGRYSSPAVLEYRERFRVNGKNISQQMFCQGLEIIRQACGEMVESGLPHPTPFEVETALAFWFFREKKCDIVVLETGMGGLNDATNLVKTTLAAVIAPIGRDHMKFLGETVEEIAAQKAGIIKPGCVVLSADQTPGVRRILKETAEDKGCGIGFVNPENILRVYKGNGSTIGRLKVDYRCNDGTLYKNLTLGLAGTFQPQNAALAIETVRALKEIKITEKALRKGLETTVWPGRFSVIGKRPLFVADGAHNEDAAKKLAESIEFYFTNKRIIYIMGMLRDKECEKVIALTAKYADQIITLTPPDNKRALSAYELAQEIAKVHPKVTSVDSVEEAVETAGLLAGPQDVILAFGSLSYLGRLIRCVERQTK